MPNLYFKRTEKKEDSSDIEAVAKNPKYSHYYHKFDGTHADLHYYKGEPIKFITREGNDITHLVPYLVESLENSSLMEAYQGVYACELVNLHKVMFEPKDVWSNSRRALGVDEFKGLENFVHCVIYDVYEAHKNSVEDLPYVDRRYNLMPPCDDETTYATFAHKIANLDYFYIPKMYSTKVLAYDWKEHIEKAKREGFVLFNLSDTECKWEHTFTKLKPLLDIDCIVTGYNLGKVGGQHEGKVGSIKIAVLRNGVLFSVGNCPSMSQSERDRWTERMLNNDDTQYVIQVKASEVTTAGKLRFPSYVRERTDKVANECLYEQLEN